LIKKAILLRSGVSFCQVWVRLCRLLTAAKLLAKSGKALNAADQIQIQIQVKGTEPPAADVIDSSKLGA
jgi:hypothetical protein